VPTPKPAAAPPAAARPKPAPPPAAHAAPAANLSPEERKRLAGEHLKALLEEKKRRLAQTPPWKRIDHHDHPAPQATDDIVPGEAETPTGAISTPRSGGDRSGD
jgi:hypothetical protein